MAQGATGGRGSRRLRTVPSAGALYPLELFWVSGLTDSLEPGIRRYLPDAHALECPTRRDNRQALAKAALGQA